MSTQQELVSALARAQESAAGKAGGRYRHYKGREYELLHVCLLESDWTGMAVYRDVESGYLWVRPLDDFLSSALVADKWMPRFQRIPP